MIPGSINGEQYPIALDESGNLQWQTVQVAEERDEVWDDWSLGPGETKRETGRGYLWSIGFDATTQGALRLSPFYHNLNTTALTTGYGYFMEDVETSGSSLAFDAASSGTLSAGTTKTVSHTVGSNAERILLVGVSFVAVSGGTNIDSVTYAGQAMTELAFRFVSGTGESSIRYLLNPPTGDNDIVVTFDGSSNAVIGGASWDGVNQDTPFGTAVTTTGTDGTPTVTVTTAATEKILAVIGVGSLETMTAGTNETERWDSQVSSTTDITGGGYTQDGVNGGVMAPTLDVKAGTESWIAVAVSVKPSSNSSRSIMMVADGDNIFKYTYDSDIGLTLDDTDNTASGGSAGRPEKTNGKWYVPFGSATNALRLDDASTPTWADASWKANHLRNFQKGIQPTLARVNSTTANTVELNADTSGDVGDTWTNESESVGDSSTDVTDLVEAQGQLFPCKEDSLWAYGSEAESFNVIPFLDRGKADSDNGKGSFAFGDEIIYMSKGNLWRHRIGGGSLPIGLNTIRSWRKIDDIIDTPKDGRPSFGVYVEEYWYYLQNDGELSHLIQARKRREGDPAGHELIQHPVLIIPLSKGLGVDSRNRLWIKGASADETKRDIRVIQLAEDGSLDIQNRKGQASATHKIFFDERNPGRPQDQVQIRRMTVETEGDWDATTSLQMFLFRDGSNTVTPIGAAITVAGVTTRNPAVGTSDTAYRFRPFLVLTTNSSYTPKSLQPDIMRLIVGIRFPEIIRIVVNAEQLALDKTGLEAFEAEQNLRRLQNQGTVTFRRPGDYDDPAAGTDLVTDRTFTGEVEGVTDIMYKTEKGYAHGLELRVKRWVTY